MLPVNLSKRFSSVLVLALLAGSISVVMPQTSQAELHLNGRISKGVKQANRQYELGKLEESEKLFRQAVNRNTGDVQAWAGLSVVQAELYKLGAAEKSAMEALRRDPKNADAHVALGTIYRHRTASSDMEYRSQHNELLNKAVLEYMTALTLDPDNPDAHNRLGEVYRQQGKMAEAEESFRKAIEYDHDFSEAVANLGTIHMDQGRTGEAISQFQKAIRLNSKNFKAHYYLGDAYTEQGRYHEALTVLNTALSLKRDNSLIHQKIGEALQKQGNMAGAISHYKEAIRLKPESFAPYDHLAKLYDYRGDNEFAITELKTGLNLNPNLDDFRLAIARQSLLLGKAEQATNYYQQVLSRQPGHPEALEGLTQTMMLVAQNASTTSAINGPDSYVDAEQMVQKALQNHPDNLGLHLAMVRLGRLSGQPELSGDHLQAIISKPARTEPDKVIRAEALAALGRYPESDEIYREMIEKTRGDSKTQLSLADTLIVNGNLDMADEMYKAVLEQDPNSLKATRGLSRIETRKRDAGKSLRLAQSLNNWYSTKQRQSAKDFYLETLGQYPRQADVRFEMGRIYESEKDYGKAIFEYQTFLNLSPNMDPKRKKNMEQKIQSLQNKLNAKAAKAAKASK